MKVRIILMFTLMSSGRAMTLWFVSRAGAGGIGDPPRAWVMPLVGDAVVGLSAVAVAWLIWKRRDPLTWLLAVVWSAIAIFDALAALLIEMSVPWPEFFMIELFGRSMFFAATALHLVILYLLSLIETRTLFGVILPGRRQVISASD